MLFHNLTARVRLQVAMPGSRMSMFWYAELKCRCLVDVGRVLVTVGQRLVV